MPGKKWFERLYAFFSILGLTRPEAYFVLLLAAAGLAGATLSVVRPYWEHHPSPVEVPDTFRAVLQALLDDTTITENRRDSLLALLGDDTTEARQWRRQADSLKTLLAAHAPRESIREAVQQIDDDPVAVININEANTEQLASLPGIGPKLAQRVIEYRSRNGPFRRIEDLRQVKGIGKKMFEKIKPFVDIR